MDETDDFIPVLQRLGLIGHGDAVTVRPLTGGVSSDIRLVDANGRRFCVKRALPTLKVAARWEVPVARNAHEAEYMRTVARWRPSIVPELLAEDSAAGLFAMAYLDPATHPVWKDLLLAGHCDIEFAGIVGERIAMVHASGAGDAQLARTFQTDDLFDALRLDPYLRATGRAHPALSARMEALAETTMATKRTLVHGDLSPKNLLVGPNEPVLLDAECAWYGDPAFDLAFCLNHLMLKGAYRPAAKHAYLAAFDRMATAYLARVDWESPAELEERAATLLPALFLARVDGKSPVEYLDEAARDHVRRVALATLAAAPLRLSAIRKIWSAAHA